MYKNVILVSCFLSQFYCSLSTDVMKCILYAYQYVMWNYCIGLVNVIQTLILSLFFLLKYESTLIFSFGCCFPCKALAATLYI